MNDDERRWLDERFNRISDDLSGIKTRLEKLNGMVRSHETQLVEHTQMLKIVRWLAGAMVIALIGIIADSLPKLIALVK